MSDYIINFELGGECDESVVNEMFRGIHLIDKGFKYIKMNDFDYAELAGDAVVWRHVAHFLTPDQSFMAVIQFSLEIDIKVISCEPIPDELKVIRIGSKPAEVENIPRMESGYEVVEQ